MYFSVCIAQAGHFIAFANNRLLPFLSINEGAFAMI